MRNSVGGGGRKTARAIKRKRYHAKHPERAEKTRLIKEKKLCHKKK